MSVLLAGTAALAAGPALALAPAGLAISNLRIDVGPLRALGAAREANRLSQTLPAAFAATFGPSLVPGRGGTTLVALVKEVFLQSYVGGDGFRSGGSQSDFLTGEVLLLDARGQVIGREKLVVNSPASSGGAYYDPASEIRRIDRLGESFAYWSRRKLGL